MVYPVRKFIYALGLFQLILFCPAMSWGQSSNGDDLVQQYTRLANNFADDLRADSAIIYYQRIAKIHEAKKQMKAYYLVQTKIAQQYLYLKQYTQAKRLLLQNLVTLKKSLIPGLEGVYFHVLGEISYKKKQFEKAWDEAKKAQQYGIVSHLTQIDNHRLMAACKARLAYPQASLEITKSCLKKLDKLTPNLASKEIKFKLLLLQSRVYIDQRAFDKSLDICYKAEQLLKTFPKKRRFLNYLLSIYTHQAIAYKNQGKLKRAIIKYRQNINATRLFFEFDYEKMAFAHKLLGRVFLSQGLGQKNMPTLDSALFHLKISADLYQKQKRVDKSELGEVYVNIGGVYHGKEQHQLAIDYYQKAYDLFKEIYGTANPHLVPLYSRWAGVYGVLKQHNRELELIQKMLIANSHQHRDLNVYTAPKINDYYNLGYHFAGLINKATLLSHRSTNLLDLQQSLRHSLMADSLVKYYYKRIFRKSDRLLVANYINVLNAGIKGINVLEVCNILHQRTGEKAYIDTAFYFVERGNASYLMSSLAESNAKKFVDISPQLLKKEAYLRKNVAKYQNQLISKPTQSTRDSLVKLNTQYETLIHELEQKYPKYAQLKFDTKQVEIKQLQAQMKSREALITYSLSRNNMNHALLITKKETRLISLPFSNNLKGLMVDYYQKMQSEARLQRFAQASHRLYQVLFQPLEK